MKNSIIDFNSLIPVSIILFSFALFLFFGAMSLESSQGMERTKNAQIVSYVVGGFGAIFLLAGLIREKD